MSHRNANKVHIKSFMASKGAEMNNHLKQLNNELQNITLNPDTPFDYNTSVIMNNYYNSIQAHIYNCIEDLNSSMDSCVEYLTHWSTLNSVNVTSALLQFGDFRLYITNYINELFALIKSAATANAGLNINSGDLGSEHKKIWINILKSNFSNYMYSNKYYALYNTINIKESLTSMTDIFNNIIECLDRKEIDTFPIIGTNIDAKLLIDEIAYSYPITTEAEKNTYFNFIFNNYIILYNLKKILQYSIFIPVNVNEMISNLSSFVENINEIIQNDKNTHPSKKEAVNAFASTIKNTTYFVASNFPDYFINYLSNGLNSSEIITDIVGDLTTDSSGRFGLGISEDNKIKMLLGLKTMIGFLLVSTANYRSPSNEPNMLKSIYNIINCIPTDENNPSIVLYNSLNKLM